MIFFFVFILVRGISKKVQKSICMNQQDDELEKVNYITETDTFYFARCPKCNWMHDVPKSVAAPLPHVQVCRNENCRNVWKIWQRPDLPRWWWIFAVLGGDSSPGTFFYVFLGFLYLCLGNFVKSSWKYGHMRRSWISLSKRMAMFLLSLSVWWNAQVSPAFLMASSSSFRMSGSLAVLIKFSVYFRNDMRAYCRYKWWYLLRLLSIYAAYYCLTLALGILLHRLRLITCRPSFRRDRLDRIIRFLWSLPWRFLGLWSVIFRNSFW